MLARPELQPAVVKAAVDTWPCGKAARVRTLEKDAPTPATLDAKAELERLTANLSTILDLLGHLQGDDALPALRDATTLSTIDLKIWAYSSLLQKGQKVPDEDLSKIAADIAHRYALLQAMKSKGVDHLFPAAFRTNRLLAESNFYDYTKDMLPELGPPPAALETLGKLVNIEDGPQALRSTTSSSSRKTHPPTGKSASAAPSAPTTSTTPAAPTPPATSAPGNPKKPKPRLTA